MKTALDAFELKEWLNDRSLELHKAWELLLSDSDDHLAIKQIENVLQSYVQKADKERVFQTVFGFEETIFDTQERLAYGYFKVGRFDDALVLHRYIAETVAKIIHGRHRNRTTLRDIRERDIDHLATTATFLIKFSEYKTLKGDSISAHQLLSEAKRLSGSWGLAKKRSTLADLLKDHSI